jgi:NADPH:quinone reductase-like Zn-dependent oxidoreductase
LTGADIRKHLRDISPKGIDVIFDPVSGPNSEVLFRAMAKEGRYLVIGFAGGSIPAIRTNLALLKSASIVGVDLRHFQAAKADEARRVRAELFHDVMYGRIAPPAKITFAFDQAAEAMKKIRERGSIGKPVICIGARNGDFSDAGL